MQIPDVDVDGFVGGGGVRDQATAAYRAGACSVAFVSKLSSAAQLTRNQLKKQTSEK